APSENSGRGCRPMRVVALIVLGVISAARADDASAGRPTAVRHEPARPKPGVPVLVTARLPKGATRPTLKLQAVAPGKYVRKADRARERKCAALPMHDDGRDGDEKAGDGVYSVLVPASYQRHRWLVRYRVVGTDVAGKEVRAPAPDDECPNFAWWCDAGPAAWA